MSNTILACSPRKRQADHVVDLLVAAGAQAARALDAGVEVDRDRRVRGVGRHLRRAARSAACRRRALRPSRRPRCGACSRVSGMSACSSSSTSFCDLTRALAVGRAPSCRRSARGSTTAPARARPRSRPCRRGSCRRRRGRPCSTGAGSRTPSRLATSSMVSPARAATSRPSSVKLTVGASSCAAFGAGDGVHACHASSCGKYLITQSTGFGAAWPRPQIDASRITCDSSASSGRSQCGCSISVERLGGAGAARRALAAGLVLEEAHQVARRVDRACRGPTARSPRPSR